MAPFENDPKAQPIPLEGEDNQFFKHFPQFFIFPLVLVTVGVLIYVFFIAAAEDRRSIDTLLSDIQNSTWPHQNRYRAAYELARQATELEQQGKKLSDEDTQRLIDILKQHGEDEKLREWILFALGRAGAEAQAIPELLSALKSSPQGSKEQISAIHGLGLSRSLEAIPELTAQLRQFTGAEFAEARQITLAAIANIALSPKLDPPSLNTVLKILEGSLEDPRWSIAWNSAATLTGEFKSAAGLPLVIKLLDRAFLQEKVSHREDQDQWIVRALRALHEVADKIASAPETLKKIEALNQDPNMKIRNEVFRIRERLKQLSPLDQAPNQIPNQAPLSQSVK